MVAKSINRYEHYGALWGKDYNKKGVQNKKQNYMYIYRYVKLCRWKKVEE